MRKTMPCLLVLLAACSTPLETVLVPIPRKDWQVGHEADSRGNGTIVEYVPRTERIEDWRHLLTVQFLEGLRGTPEAAVAELEQKARGYGGTVEWQVLEHDGNSVLYEWRLLDCPRQDQAFRDQCEVARMLRGNDGLHRVAYTVRDRTMDPAAREMFLKAFRDAYVVKGPEKQRVVVAP